MYRVLMVFAMMNQGCDLTRLFVESFILGM